MRNALTKAEVDEIVDYCIKYLNEHEDVLRIGYAIGEKKGGWPSPHAISQIEVRLTRTKKYVSRPHSDQKTYKGDYEIYKSGKGFFERHPIWEKIFIVLISAIISLITALAVKRSQEQAHSLKELQQDSAIRAIGDSVSNLLLHQKTTFSAK